MELAVPDPSKADPPLAWYVADDLPRVRVAVGWPRAAGSLPEDAGIQGPVKVRDMRR